MKKTIKFKKISLLLALMLSLLVFAACETENGEESTDGEEGLSGAIEIDGSSTVYPITMAMAEEFQITNQNTEVTVGVSGTGGGMKRFIVGDTNISDASREIKEEEAKVAEENGIEFTRLTVALDGISVVVNSNNDWIDDITVEELKEIWKPNSSMKMWSDVNSEWPEEEIKLYGPGTDSGTFDYFTEMVVGESGSVRTDFTASEDDNVLVQGVAGDEYSLGYFGYAYYEENKDKLKALNINGVEPTPENIGSGKYKPLARPIFIYVNNDHYKNQPQVKEFVDFYLESGASIVPSTGYVALTDERYKEEKNKLK